MNVHVPQPGNQKFAGRIDDAHSWRRIFGFQGTSINRKDSAPADCDPDVFTRRRPGPIDKRGVFEDDLGSRGLPRSRATQRG